MVNPNHRYSKPVQRVHRRRLFFLLDSSIVLQVPRVLLESTIWECQPMSIHWPTQPACLCLVGLRLFLSLCIRGMEPFSAQTTIPPSALLALFPPTHRLWRICTLMLTSIPPHKTCMTLQCPRCQTIACKWNTYFITSNMFDSCSMHLLEIRFLAYSAAPTRPCCKRYIRISIITLQFDSHRPRFRGAKPHPGAVTGNPIL